ncbi:MAG: L-2-hydroxyglutarate oxidase [Thermodesulfobacteriota bacterium]
MDQSTDILIVGGGIIGLCVARECAKRWPGLRITIIEKEGSPGEHASGRNSGVLHAGFYYSAESLKANFTREGNRALTEYCLNNNLSINRCGKVVVTKDERDLKGLDELNRRGVKNGVTLKIIDENELRDIEPNARTFSKALYCPDTSSVDPKEVVGHIAQGLMETDGVEILFGEAFVEPAGPSKIKTTGRTINYKHLVNASGLYADKVAHTFGVGLKYSMVPFKGRYIEYKETDLIRVHIYPVPDLERPFLGVHFTKTVDGKVKVGPTAVPALWRENYKGIDNFKFNELLESLTLELKLFYTNKSNFRDAAFDEMKRYFRKNLIREASTMVKEIDYNKFGDYLKPGIRAQLLNTGNMTLEMDFVIEEGDSSTHILNAVSPAFTCSFPFSAFVVDKIAKRDLF